MEQKKLRALMADAGVTDINRLSANGGGPRVMCFVPDKNDNCSGSWRQHVEYHGSRCWMTLPT